MANGARANTVRRVPPYSKRRVASPPAEARAAYVERYADEGFVRVLDPGVWPETRAVRNSNRCDLTVTTVHGGRTLLATAADDPLAAVARALERNLRASNEGISP